MEHVSILLASAAALPRRESLDAYLDDIARAEARGYFTPEEDERLREVYGRYLAIRASLLQCLESLSQGRWSHRHTENLRAFVVAYAAACLLVRAAGYLVELTGDAPITRKKLDEPEPRYRLPAKTFTGIYKSLTSPRRWWGFFDATAYYHKRRDEIAVLASDPELGKVVELLRDEVERIELQRDELIQQRLRYRLHSWLRRSASGYRKAMFSLFELSGSRIADLKQPFVKPVGSGKRVDDAVRERVEGFLRPGDILVTRHDDALSNLFLPGFWPHAAFYIGCAEQREAMGVQCSEPVNKAIRFIEAKKDGVRLRPPSDTLQVDAFVVLRPSMPESEVALAVERALSHAGKLYDFLFDFTSADRLACTELVYRSYHSVGSVQLDLQSRAGRHCLSAEDLLNQLIGQGWFEPVLIYGLDGNEWQEGPAVRERLRASFDASFELKEQKVSNHGSRLPNRAKSGS